MTVRTRFRAACHLRGLAVALIGVLLAANTLTSQAQRRLTTVEALRRFPAFYHLQDVAVRGRIANGAAGPRLQTDEHEIRLLTTTPLVDGPSDVRGTLFDVGRLERNDSRLTGYSRPDTDDWPRPGEELVLKVSAASPVPPGTPTVSIAAIALEPWRFEGQALTLIGQFRGRNLFGDSAVAPKRSAWDFVLRRGDATVWVVGLRPKGKGFDLSVDARVDTGRWLAVTGVFRRNDGLPVLEATRMEMVGEPGSDAPREIPDAAPLSPVEVVFSIPTSGETEVATSTPIRIQFSRNVKPESLTDRIRLTYGTTNGAAPSAVPAYDLRYDAAARAVELRFRQPLDALRDVRIELLPGIEGFDGAPLLPWALTFTVGR